MNAHTFLQEGGGAPQTAEQIADLLTAAEQAGVKWIRLPFYWGNLQGTPCGPIDYNADNTDVAIQRYRERGFLIIGAIVDAPPAYTVDGRQRSPIKPEYLACWQQFVRSLDQQYGDVVKYWGVLNEVNSPTWYHSDLDPEFVRYEQMVTHAAEAAPGKIALGSPTLMLGGSTDWIQQRMQHIGGAVSLIPVHMYTDGSTDQVVGAVRSALEARARAGYSTPVWLTEFGLNAPARWDDQPIVRMELETTLIGGVLRAMLLGGAGSGWEKSFYYRLWSESGADADSTHSLVGPQWDGQTFPRNDRWYMYRHFAAGGPEWLPVSRWWRTGDGMWSTDPGAGSDAGYTLISTNAWSTSRHAFSGWHPLFRCWYSDPASNDAHFVTQQADCRDPAYARAGTLTDSYGMVSSRPRPELGLVALRRFEHRAMSDYVATTDPAEAAEILRSSGWEERPVLGYAWPRGYRP